MTCSRRSSCLFACLLLACETRLSGTDGDESGGETSDTGTGDCMPVSAVEFTVMDNDAENDELLQVAPCTVTAVEHDPDDPARWTFTLDCIDEVAVELITDPPLDELPLTVGQELQGRVSDGAEFQMVELGGADGPLIALFYTSGPPGGIDQPIFVNNPFEFEWSPVPGCTATDAECSAANQLRIDASAGGEPLSLEPEQRHGVLTGTSGESYGLWIGDSWAGDCGGQASETLRYAVVALP